MDIIIIMRYFKEVTDVDAGGSYIVIDDVPRSGQTGAIRAR